jgi:hypothetical protein
MKPILFNAEMVQAILDSRKTVTRRLIKPQPDIDLLREHQVYAPVNQMMGLIKSIRYLTVQSYINHHAPYQLGDVLYVRETWRVGAWNEDISSIAIDYKADRSARKEWIYIEDEEEFQRYWIQSTDDAEKAGLITDADGQYHWNVGESPTRWRPSIHMPKEVARIFLKVTDIRAERLQELTVEQAKREGAFHACNMCTIGMIIADKELHSRVIVKSMG